MDLRRATAVDLDAVVGLQQAAYARNRALLGVEPLPLQADYAEIFQTMEVWLAEPEGRLDGVLILKLETDHLLIWSIATRPDRQASGLGRVLLACADDRAGELGLTKLKLYTGSMLVHLIDWYGRHGYVVERVESLADRQITHMAKTPARETA